MVYVSTKCKAKGRHCDCVTGPFLQSGGVVRPNPQRGEVCACPCHHYPGATREMFDSTGMTFDEVQRYATVIKPNEAPR